jgi:hypothetical protein
MAASLLNFGKKVTLNKKALTRDLVVPDFLAPRAGRSAKLFRLQFRVQNDSPQE